jgi:uncharacterized protein YjiS (DUF1127 family)
MRKYDGASKAMACRANHVIPKLKNCGTSAAVLFRTPQGRTAMFTTLCAVIVTWYRRHDAIMRLRWLDDHVLADMGIERDQIKAHVRRAEQRMAKLDARREAVPPQTDCADTDRSVAAE